MSNTAGKLSRRVFAVGAMAVAIMTACAPSAPTSPAANGGSSSPAAPVTQPTTLRIALAEDAPQFSGRLGNLDHTLNAILNSGLGIIDDHGVTQPMLIDALPSQDSGTWVVNPDGTMKTTYHLRANALWQDGQPVTANDVVFAYKVYTDKDVPVFGSTKTEKLADTVTAIDDKTVEITWKSLYFGAGFPTEGDFAPLPSHLMEQSYNTDKQTFINSSFWTSSDYVGAGAYKVAARDLGSGITLAANPYFVMGKPKIDTIQIKMIPDKNAIVTHFSGDVDFAEYPEIQQQQAVALAQQWNQNGNGAVTNAFWQTRNLIFQYRDVGSDPSRPDYPPAVRDVRIRQALMYAIDRDAFADEESGGTATAADSNYAKSDALFPRVDAAVTHYPYDLTKAAQLFSDAGWTKGADGMFRNSAGQTFDMPVISTPDHPTEAVVIADNWTKAGLNGIPQQMPAGLVEDNSYRVSFPGAEVDTGGKLGDCNTTPITATLPTAANGWVGDRGSFADPETDAIVAACNQTVDPMAHDNFLVQLQSAFTAKVAKGYLYYRTLGAAARSNVKGVTGLGQIGSGTFAFNIWDWSIQ